MTWCWEQAEWPNFHFNINELELYETEFLKQAGMCLGAYTHVSEEDKIQLKIDLITEEAQKTSQIEGELLDRDSIQASICRQFGLAVDHRRIPPSEEGIAAMMVDIYRHYQKSLTHEQLHHWHKLLMKGHSEQVNRGSYRSRPVPTQIVSGSLQEPKIHFEAPPSKIVQKEMERFLVWFNESGPNSKKQLPALIRAGIAHLYFVIIHPFEDGNGRIARAIAEKSLAQNLNQPTLIALAYAIEQDRKAYYKNLEATNKSCDITSWLHYFSKTVLNAQLITLKRIEFIIQQNRLLERLKGKLNSRQEKALMRMLREGINGFKGGLSAQNYIAITKASKATATRDLQDLVLQGALIRKGDLRYARYYLNIPLLSDFTS